MDPRALLSFEVSWRPRHRVALEKVLLQILQDHSLQGVLEVTFVGDARIQDVHREFFDLDTPTDVISFDLRSGPPLPHDPTLGQVLVSVETAAREARKRKVPLEHEAALYALHGTLHLAGFDDLEPGKKRRMRRAEARYLAIFQSLSRGQGRPGSVASAARGALRGPRARGSRSRSSLRQEPRRRSKTRPPARA